MIIVIGAGLAGVEAAWQLAGRGLKVDLYEAKPVWFSPAHRSENFAELVCSNSLKSEEEGHATALLKQEMRALGSLVLEAADAVRVPGGKALAVDRELFSKYITGKICSHPNIRVIREEVKSLQFTIHDSPAFAPMELRRGGQFTIIATGPLTSPSLAKSLLSLLSHHRTIALSHLFFYDSIAPIVEAGSVDMNIAFRASRYGIGTESEGDYINCPMTSGEYNDLVSELLRSRKIEPQPFDDIKCFEGCMPIEVMAERHVEALRHGPMKPFGIIDPRTGKCPYAVLQLRQDDLHKTLYNMVGMQTRMVYSEQDRVLRTVPGLAAAKFSRYGSMHRNTYINAPLFLDEFFRLKKYPNVFMAGQLTGVEGYLESAATGLYVGMMSRNPIPFTTAIGALIRHATLANNDGYQPMNINWGIFPPLLDHPYTRKGPRKADRRRLLISRARADFETWVTKPHNFA